MMMLVADVAVAEDADVMASVMTIMEVVVLVAMDHVVPLVVDLVPLEPISNDYRKNIDLINFIIKIFYILL